MSVLMQCGHTASGTTSNGDPSCIICTGLTSLAEMVADVQPSVEGRTARCGNCKGTTKSSFSLPFFSYRPNSDTDGYYCGCRGWE